MTVLTRPDLMRVLHDGLVKIDPMPKPEHIGPNSIDLHLAPMLLTYADITLSCDAPNATVELECDHEGYFYLEPGELYLGRTIERTCTPHHVPYIGGRSSVGRLGISIHCTAGFGDVGFSGTWTLEITVVKPVYVKGGMRIAQLWLFDTSSPVPPEEQYRGRYQGQIDPTPSKFGEGE